MRVLPPATALVGAAGLASGALAFITPHPRGPPLQSTWRAARTSILSGEARYTCVLRAARRGSEPDTTTVQKREVDLLVSEPEPEDPEQKETGAFDRESRQLIGILAGLGTLETSFLTYEKLFRPEGLSNLCSVGGLSLRCGDVLNSEYANVLGVPLTLPAIFAYGSVFLLALAPLLTKGEAADIKTRDPLLLLTTSMATFSAYLMWLLATKLGTACPFCLASAALSFSMAAITWTKQVVPSATRANVYKVGSVLTTSLLSGLVYLITSTQALVASQSFTSGSPEGGPFAPPAITTHSDQRALRVADRLQALDSSMYGAFWCSHCYEQKQTLGREAYSQVKYIECAKDGLNSQTKLCKEKQVPGYPTWEIKGELYPGEKTLEQLEELTGLRAPAAEGSQEGGDLNLPKQ